jgi:hypothetical protein
MLFLLYLQFEAYTSRGPVWYIVGVTQTAHLNWGLEFPDLLGAFNEQIGDLLKEIQHCEAHEHEDEIENATEYAGKVTEEIQAVSSLGAILPPNTDAKDILKFAKCSIISGKCKSEMFSSFPQSIHKCQCPFIYHNFPCCDHLQIS